MSGKRDPDHFTGGRPFSVLSHEKVEELKSEFAKKKFNISKRARELGVKRSALAYHLRGGKISVVIGLPEWRRHVRRCLAAARADDATTALMYLRKAVVVLENDIKAKTSRKNK